MIRKCSGTCGLQETVQPYKDGRTITFRCLVCKGKDRREMTYRHRVTILRETVVTKTLVVCEG